MKRFKKQFLAAALIVALGAAVYLNWSISAPKTTPKTLGESKFVNATVATTAVKKTSAKAKSSGKLTEKQREFFASAKTTRQKAQDKVVDIASDVLELDTASDSEKSKAQSNVAAVIKNFTLQDTIESTLKAKGFSNCLCYITDSGCTVTVLKSELERLKPIAVKSTVQSEADIGFNKITIVTI